MVQPSIMENAKTIHRSFFYCVQLTRNFRGHIVLLSISLKALLFQSNMSSIMKRFYTIVGNVTLEHVKQQNKNGAQWVASIDKVAKAEESSVRDFY